VNITVLGKRISADIIKDLEMSSSRVICVYHKFMRRKREKTHRGEASVELKQRL
jgi:hypothetical protein